MTDISELINREPAAPLPEPRERKRLRQLFGVTQAKLASVLSVTRQTIIEYEKGGSEPKGERRTEYAAILSAWQETESQRKESQ